MLHRTLRIDDDEDLRTDFAVIPGADLPSPPGITNADTSPDCRETYPLGVVQQLIDGLSEQAALVGDDGKILAVNKAWAQTVRLNGISDFAPGADYYREIAKLAQAGNAPAAAVLRALDQIRQGKRKSFRMVYEGGGQQAGMQFEARLSVLSVGGRSCLMVTRYDITELAQLRTLRDDLKLSLLKTQEDERRRMGRELHDSGLQLLTCFSLALVRLKRAQSASERRDVVAEMEELLLMSRREFRAISYLAHPPQLENLSLIDALTMLVEGLGQRSGLEVEVAVDEPFPALGHAAEHAIYRVVQEAISNVHRHAGARHLSLRLVVRERWLHVLVGDDGRGIPDGVRHGVGLGGMQARLEENGGRLTIMRGGPGTTIVASLPLLGPRSR